MCTFFIHSFLLHLLCLWFLPPLSSSFPTSLFRFSHLTVQIDASVGHINLATMSSRIVGVVDEGVSRKPIPDISLRLTQQPNLCVCFTLLLLSLNLASSIKVSPFEFQRCCLVTWLESTRSVSAIFSFRTLQNLAFSVALASLLGFFDSYTSGRFPFPSLFSS
ncbi:hypothetical protein RJT34_22701 [Clitoria ternatea]|uniref:Uncharacterized protein n=1 Tax=Clitoria ternatea TaxID=43366 RepID=A0AAN9FLY6_CLITE